MKRNIVFCIFCMLVGQFDVCWASASSLQSALDQYKIALQDFIQVYKKNDKAIVFESSDVLISVYDKLLYPSVLYISSYAQILNSIVLEHGNYTAALLQLQSEFNTYKKYVTSIVLLFPKQDQTEAWNYFYNQLSNIVIATCMTIIQAISARNTLSSEDLDNAYSAYGLSWQIQNPTMKLSGYEQVQDFQTAITQDMVNIYQAAIKEQKSKINYATSDPSVNQKIFANIMDYYKKLEQIYTNAGDGQSAQKQALLYKQMQTTATDFSQALTMYQAAESQAKKGRLIISINNFQGSNVLSELKASIKELDTASKTYQQAGEQYDEAEDMKNSPGGLLCQNKNKQVLADLLVRSMQQHWALFCNDQYQDSSRQDFKELTSFYAADPNKATIDVLQIIQILDDIKTVLTKAPNILDSKFYITNFVTNALSLYQAAHITLPEKPLVGNETILELVSTVLSNFETLCNDMISVASLHDQSDISNTIQSMQHTASTIDTAFEGHSYLKDYIFYFPILLQNVSKQSFVDFGLQYVYRILVAQALHAEQSALGYTTTSSMYYTNMLQALSYYSALQQIKAQLSSEQAAFIQQKVQNISNKVDLIQQASDIYQQALENTDWSNRLAQSGKVGVYKSVADSLWQKSIMLYELAMQVAKTSASKTVGGQKLASVQATYVQTLQLYIQHYMQNTSSVTWNQFYMIIPLYKLYIAATAVSDSHAVSFAQVSAKTLFSDNQGLFDQVHMLDSKLSESSLGTQEKASLQQSLSEIIDLFKAKETKQVSVQADLKEMFSSVNVATNFIDIISDKQAIVVNMNLAGSTFTVQVTDPAIVTLNLLTADATNYLQVAHSAEAKGDFSTAAAEYKKLETVYSGLYQVAQTSAQQVAYDSQYYVSKTLHEACSLASFAQPIGSQIVGDLKDVPTSFYSTDYELADIDMASLGNVIPHSLQSFSTSFQQTTTADQKQDALSVFKAYLIAQALKPQGLAFSDCYQDYTLKPVSDLDKTDAAIAKEIEDVVSLYVKGFDNITLYVALSQGYISFYFENMPIPAITPLYPNGPCADVYLVGASTLFAPGTKDISITGTGESYLPGNDKKSQLFTLELLGYAYVTQAAQNLLQAQSSVKVLSRYITGQEKNKEDIDPTTFLSLYKPVSKGFLKAQALLFAQDGSAYFYFNQAKQQTKADDVETIYLNSYSMQIKLLKQLLVGNPFAAEYQIVLNDIKNIYASWNGALDPNKDAVQIKSNYQDLIDLYQKAASICMKYQKQSKTFPGIMEIQYLGAAADYMALSNIYKSNGDSAHEEAMKNQALKAYVLLADQNMAIYYQAQKTGVMFVPMNSCGNELSTKQKTISINKLFSDYQQYMTNAVCMDNAELAAYKTLKDLLIKAAMYYKYLESQYAVGSQKSSKSDKQADQKNTLNSTLLSYLQKKGICSSSDTNIPFTKQGILQQLCKISIDVYTQFLGNDQVLQSWMNVLSLAVAYQYIDDYLGGFTSNQEFINKYQEFYQVVQQELTKMQNPASSYVN